MGEGGGEEDDEHQQAGNESQKSNLEDKEARYERRSTEFEFELKVDYDVTLNEGSLAAKVGIDVSKTHGEEKDRVIAYEESGYHSESISRDNIEIVEGGEIRESMDPVCHQPHNEEAHACVTSKLSAHKIVSPDIVIQ